MDSESAYRDQCVRPRKRAASAMLVLFALAAGAVGAAVAADGSADRDTGDAATDGAKKVHPLVPALRYAKSSLKAARESEDYTATFMKRDIVDGQVYGHTMFLKFRRKPFSVYLKFKEPHAGREVIYVKGQNGGKLLAHETGFAALVGTVALAPTSPQAMSESKHPITEIGMEKLVKGIVDQWQREVKFGEIDVKYYPEATHKKLGNGRDECLVIQATHPHPRKQFKFHMTRLWIDRDTNLPVRVSQFGFANGQSGQDPPLLEEYTYTDIDTDVELRDIDFDARNPEYGF